MSRPNVVVLVLALGGIVVSLMQTLVIPLIPTLPGLLRASPADATWVITATLLASAVATPVVGRLGDMYGKRRLLLVSLVLLVAGSVVAALSSTLVPMIVGRALQGLAAGVIPLGISIMRDELPADRLGSATATMSASLGVGGALGLPAAAFLAENADWHLLFWTAAALGALVTVLVLVPSGLVMLAVAPVSARITTARGPKTTLMLGALTVALGYATGAVLMSAVWQLLLVSAIIGAGIGLAYGAMPALIMGAVPVSETAAANSLNTLMRAIGTSISSAVAGSILAQLTVHFGPATVPSETAFRLIMTLGCATALAALAIAAFIPGTRSQPSAATEAPGELLATERS